ncbi:MAG: DUF3576 domain-containing protein [Halocynthiibacter sp.]
MLNRKYISVLLLVAVAATTSGCGTMNRMGKAVGNVFKGDGTPAPKEETYVGRDKKPKSTIWDLFSNAKDPNVNIEVNKYIWNASLEVLGFLPIKTVDPFSGVIVTGYGRPPGGGRSYRATVLVQDPALDARSLNVSLATKSGPVNAETVRAVEDAILTRARQLRIRDSRL